MLEHLAGRPSALWKRNQIVLVLLFWLWRVTSGDARGPRIFYIRRINKFLSKFTPWQIIIATLSTLYVTRNTDTILGLGSPEPLANLYSPDFYRSTWINTALDAGFATAMSIQPKFLRDILSVVFFLYYLVYAREADEKLRRFRAICTVEMLRTTWNKTSNPYIRAATYFARPRIPIVRRLFLSRPRGSAYTKPVACTLFYAGSSRDLASDSHGAGASELIYDIPGGGFVAMSPEHHEERLRRWTIKTGRPILSLDYGKAPEHPYPWALNEAFDVYRVLAESNGRAIGMSGRRPIKVILSGDSAGANVAVALMCKIIESTATPLALTRNGTPIPPLPYPNALVLAYPALDFNFTSWMTREHLDVLRKEQRAAAADSAGAGKFLSKRTTSMTNVKAMKRLAEQKDHLGHKSPLAVIKDVRPTRLAVVDASSLAPAKNGRKKKQSSSPTATASDATTTKTSGKRSRQTSSGGHTPAGPEQVQRPDQNEGKETIVMGVRHKKSWSQSLSGTFKMLSPVVPSSTSASTPSSPTSFRGGGNLDRKERSAMSAGIQVSNGSSPSPAPSLTRPPFLLPPAGGGQQLQKLSSKDSSLKNRLRENIPELDGLEVNITNLDLTPKADSFAGPHADAGVVANDRGAVVELSTGDSTPVPPTTGGIEADESSLSETEETSESDSISGVPEGEREYYPLADKDKPLGARVLYPSDDEMGEFYHANADPHSAHPFHTSPDHPTTAAAGTGAGKTMSSSPLLSPVTTFPVGAAAFDRGQVEVERVTSSRVERESSKLASEDKKTIVRPGKKVPIGTRLTMTSRAGFFQDRIVSPSMMRAMSILYIGPKQNPDFSKDYYISPILTPANVLVYFPPVLMVCGERDPFVDDTVIFGGRLREAKRARRAEMLASRQGAGESLRMSRPNSSSHGHAHAGLRGDDARRAREQALLYEDESAWVEMRILEGWGHGFLQMTPTLLLGRAAENVLDEMADWMVDVFASPKKGNKLSHETNGISPLVPVPGAAAAVLGNTTPTAAKRTPPPRISTSVVGTMPSSDIPPPPRHHPKRPSSVSSSTRRASSPHSSPYHAAQFVNGGRASSPATRSRLPVSDGLPLVSSSTETETERDGPLTFIVARKTNSNGNRTPRNSFGAAESQATAPSPSLRRTLLQHANKQQSSPSSNEAAVAVQRDGLVLPSSLSSPSSPENSNSDVHHLNDDYGNQPLSPATATETSFGFGRGYVDFAPKQSPASPKPGGGGATTLISQTELMRRRREDAVFGMGEREAADDDGGMTEYWSPVRTRSPSPAAMRHGGHVRAWNGSSAELIDKNANGV